jgi:hypothetical protein
VSGNISGEPPTTGNVIAPVPVPIPNVNGSNIGIGLAQNTTPGINPIITEDPITLVP